MGKPPFRIHPGATLLQAYVYGLQGLASINIRHSLESAVDPTSTDDSSKGYLVSSIWVNRESGAVFFCTNSTPNEAAWSDLTGGGVGGDLPAPVSGDDFSMFPNGEPPLVGMYIAVDQFYLWSFNPAVDTDGEWKQSPRSLV